MIASHSFRDRWKRIYDRINASYLLRDIPLPMQPLQFFLKCELDCRRHALARLGSQLSGQTVYLSAFDVHAHANLVSMV